MINKLSSYKSIIFDCDGVILNSNKVKTQAFSDLAKPWGNDAQKLLVAHHVSNGGISRHKKIHFFLHSILPSLSISISKEDSIALYEELISRYSELVYQGLCLCDVSPALKGLRKLTQYAKWSIVSGGDQLELRRLFQRRGLFSLFDAGIFGSPDNKELILQREFANMNIVHPALFIGDSKYDYLSACSVDIDFLFLSSWTELEDWQSFVSSKNIPHLPSLISLESLQ